MKTVLMVDTDPAFLLWLGQLLVTAGYHAVPALSVLEAKSLIARYRLKVDLILINAALSDARCFIDDVRQASSRLSVIVMVDEPARVVSGRWAANLIHSKNSGEIAPDPSVWLEVVERILTDPPISMASSLIRRMDTN